MPIDLVIFDCDGVLVDSEPIAARVLAEVAGEFGYDITPAECINRFTGVDLRTVRAGIEADWGRALPLAFERVLAERDRAAFAAELRPIDGVAGILDRLTARRCVASSGALEKIRFNLAVTGLLDRFEPHLFSATMVARGKPAPDLFLLAAQKLGVATGACLVVEDSIAGISAAVAAGMHAFGFVGGGHVGAETAAALAVAGAERVFDAMAELPELLAERA